MTATACIDVCSVFQVLLSEPGRAIGDTYIALAEAGQVEPQSTNFDRAGCMFALNRPAIRNRSAGACFLWKGVHV